MSVDAGAHAIAADVRAGRMSAVEVVEASLGRIAERDGEINAFTVVLADSARNQAAAIDARRDAGEALGPLAGVPISVKDHLWMADQPATNGSLALVDFVPTETCVAVQRLVDAGAVVVGRTNNPEFCYRGFTDNAVYGLTRNPRDLSRTPGGSSGGAGASVAAGMVPLAIGTDGGGSIRIPAAFCGIVGLKPTFGLVPKLPGFRGWPSLSVNGPLARSVRDLALATAVMAGPTPADSLSYPSPHPVDPAAPAADLAGLRIAVSPDLGFATLDADVRAAFEQAVSVLRHLDVERTHPAGGDPVPMWDVTALAEGFASEGPLLARFADVMTPATADLVRGGEQITAAEYLDAQHQRDVFTRVWEEFFTEYDVLLAPAMPITAFETGRLGPLTVGGAPVVDSFDAWCALALPANLTGGPAVGIPIGLGSNGLPIGLQIIGPRWSDDRVLKVAQAVLQLLSPSGRPDAASIPHGEVGP